MTGTPKTLKEAIANARAESSSRAQWHIRDYLAQKFTVAMHYAESAAERERLMQLFNALTKDEKK